jgi:hypothetical protein
MDDSMPATSELSIRLRPRWSGDAAPGGQDTGGQQLIGTVDFGVGIVDFAAHGVASWLAGIRLDRLRARRTEWVALRSEVVQ